MSERIYLVPGFFGFANLGDLKYFGHVHAFLGRACERLGIEATIRVVRTPPTSSLRTRAAYLAEAIGHHPDPIHLIGHSSGGLDARLLVAPDVSLPTHVDIERIAARARTVVTVATPHHGTPLASFFTGLLGPRLLQLFSLSTMYSLRFGHPPISAALKLAAAFARLDGRFRVNRSLLDQLFEQLLGDLSPTRRRTIGRLLRHVGTDQALLAQLTPEGMDVFNALARTRPGVRCGSVVTSARRPGLRSALAGGLDPVAQASHVVYQTLYRVNAMRVRAYGLRPTRKQARVLVNAYGRMPPLSANDGIVPTLSQVWGDAIHAARADHLDVIGHFHGPASATPHYDWLATGTGFDRRQFESVWTDVAAYLARGMRTRVPGLAARGGDVRG